MDWIRVFRLIGFGSFLRFFFKWFWNGFVGLGFIFGLNFKIIEFVIDDFLLVDRKKGVYIDFFWEMKEKMKNVLYIWVVKFFF